MTESALREATRHIDREATLVTASQYLRERFDAHLTTNTSDARVRQRADGPLPAFTDWRIGYRSRPPGRIL